MYTQKPCHAHFTALFKRIGTPNAYYTVMMEDRQEIALYLKEIARYPKLGSQEERDLLVKAKKGDRQATNTLVCSHLQLVVGVARRYHKHHPLADLVQEGNIGLLDAIEKFDLKWQNRFATYASHCVRQSILRAIYNQSRTMRLPVHLYEKYMKIRRFIADYRNEHGIDPDALKIAEVFELTVEAVEKLKSCFQNSVSLETYHQDVLAPCETPETLAVEKADHEDRARVIEQSLSGLREKEQGIVRLYYGLNQDTGKTLEEISLVFNLTKERIRQIKKISLERLSVSVSLKHHYLSE
ncbi:MAG: RNA polymerase sigma factor RpoD/SigA [Candidatus Wallbacteria bacterium]|nr:RNA polymerase sigma factor RpoD/SigA [Candidatus Wallbacteria bacterium]